MMLQGPRFTAPSGVDLLHHLQALEARRSSAATQTDRGAVRDAAAARDILEGAEKRAQAEAQHARKRGGFWGKLKRAFTRIATYAAIAGSYFSGSGIAIGLTIAALASRWKGKQLFGSAAPWLSNALQVGAIVASAREAAASAAARALFGASAVAGGGAAVSEYKENSFAAKELDARADATSAASRRTYQEQRVEDAMERIRQRGEQQRRGAQQLREIVNIQDAGAQRVRG